MWHIDNTGHDPLGDPGLDEYLSSIVEDPDRITIADATGTGVFGVDEGSILFSEVIMILKTF